MLVAIIDRAENRGSIAAASSPDPAFLPESVRFAALAILLAVVVGGCGRQSLFISGTVSVDGRPLADGAVFLDPVTPDGSGTGGGPVTNGRFLIVGGSRIHPGRFKINLVAFSETGRMLRDTQRGNVPERIPVTLGSILPAMIELRSGENKIDIAANSFSGEQPR